VIALNIREGWLLIAVVSVVWIATVVHVARTKTNDPMDRLVWLLIVIFLNFIGALLYFVWGPGREDQPELTPDEYEKDIKRRANEGLL
jgi:hypothetical protein